jgi:very-short-patch-repair endonuclease
VKTHCRLGHQYTTENIYFRPGKASSPECRVCRRGYRQRNLERRALGIPSRSSLPPAELGRCPICNGSMPLRHHHKSGPRKYCSRVCYHASQLRGSQNPRWRPRVERVCRVCSMRFLVRQKHLRKYKNGGRTCSRSCNTKMNRRNQHFRTTLPEKRMAWLLDALGVQYTTEHLVPGVGVVDFFVPEDNVAIEVDGAYWHSLPPAQFKDPWKDAGLSVRGIDVVRVSSRDLLTPHEHGGMSRKDRLRTEKLQV